MAKSSEVHLTGPLGYSAGTIPPPAGHSVQQQKQQHGLIFSHNFKVLPESWVRRHVVIKNTLSKSHKRQELQIVAQRVKGQRGSWQ